MKNYFLVYRPFHYEYVLRIISEHHPGDDNVIVNHSGVEYKTSAGNISVINIPRGFAKRMKLLKAVKKDMLQWAQADEPMAVFMPHTLGILANYSYYQLAEKHKNVTINFFYEGVIVFYDYQHHYLKNFRHYASRYFAGLLSGIKFTFDKRLLNLNSPKVSKIYSPFLSIDAPKEKLVQSSLGEIEYTINDDSCVILGLRMPARFDKEMTDIIRRMYSKIKELGIKTVFFKDHPYEKNEQFILIAKEEGITLSLIEDPQPIEKIIDKYRPKFVFSIWSSGLMNLKTMLPGEIRIFSVVGKEIVEDQKLTPLLDVFAKTGIEIIWV
ncbi:MAG: hypothetical protein JNL60_12675 [Bacteroidia bacterium]|nr:hypothetical protein [Bacteroidia bacterium]